MNTELRITAICAAALLTATPPAVAQSPQYLEPGSRARAPQDARDQLERERRAARWELGKIKVDPRFWIREVGYRDNVFGASEDEEAIADYTLTAGAGLVAFVNLGRKVVAKASLLPEYAWWQDLSELNDFNVSGEAELFGLFNKATAQLGWRRTTGQGQLNDELETPVETDNETLFLDWTVELTSRLSLFGRFSTTELRQENLVAGGGPSSLALLDRDEEVIDLGVEYSPKRGLVVGLGVEESEADFSQDPASRSNSGTSPLLRFEVGGDAASIQGNLVSKDVEFASGVGLDELTGSLRASRTIGTSGLIAAYADRTLVYSALDAASYYLDETVGIAAEMAFARRFRLQVFAETGENRFRDVVTGEDVVRLDEVDSLGATLVFRLSDRTAIALRGERTQYDSNLAQFDRAVKSVAISLGLSDDLFLRR